MADLPTSGIRFDGVGATAGSAEEAARVLATRLNHWLDDHPNCRILDLKMQGASSGANLELTAILAYIDESGSQETKVTAAAAAVRGPEAVVQAEEIIADAQHERGENAEP